MQEFKKIYCPLKNAYALLTVDDGIITNFQAFKEEAVKDVVNSSSLLPPISKNLLPCQKTGSRVPHSVDLSSCCVYKNGEMTYQCLFCSAYQVPSSGGPYDVYFLMDESGSMSFVDRKQAVVAIREAIADFAGMGNLYNFVPWGTEADYIFRNETSIDVIENGLKLYEQGKTGLRGRTCAEKPFDKIRDQVRTSPREAIIFFVTDGRLENLKKAVEARNKVLEGRPSATIIAIGIAEAEKESLNAIGNTKKLDLELIKDSGGLKKAFKDVVAAIKNNGGNV